MTNLKGSVLTSNVWAAKLTESDRLLEHTRPEVASLKEQVARVNTEKVEFDMLVALVREE